MRKSISLICVIRVCITPRHTVYQKLGTEKAGINIQISCVTDPRHLKAMNVRKNKKHVFSQNQCIHKIIVLLNYRYTHVRRRIYFSLL